MTYVTTIYDYDLIAPVLLATHIILITYSLLPTSFQVLSSLSSALLTSSLFASLVLAIRDGVGGWG